MKQIPQGVSELREFATQGKSAKIVPLSSMITLALCVTQDTACGGMRTQAPSHYLLGAVFDDVRVTRIEKDTTFVVSYSGDPYGNRTHVTAVKGPCLNRLTNGPFMVADVGFEPTTCRV